MNKLMESELYRLIARNVQELIWFQKPTGELEYVSPSVTNLLGYQTDEMVGTTAMHYIHPADTQTIHETIAHTHKRQQTGRLTCRLKHKTGKFLWFESTYTAIYTDQGVLERILGVGRDITEQKQMEQRLLRAERIAHLGSWDRSARDCTLYWSDEMYRIFGLETGTPMTVDRFLSMVHPEDRESLMDSISKTDKGAPYDIVYRIIRTNGEVRTVHAQGEVECGQNSSVNIYGSLQDITDYKNTEQELRTSKENLKLAQKIARLGHWDWDVKHNKLFWSDELYNTFGLTEADKPDGIEDFFRLVHPDELAQVRRSIEASLLGAPFDIEFRALLPDGSSPLVHLIGETDFDSHGRAIRLFGIAQDVTVQRQTEELLRTSEKLNVAGQLAAGIAHEIRNPLTVLKGFLQMLSQPVMTQDNRYFDIMKSELVRIESIVNELLFLAKPQAAVYQDCDLTSIMQEVITLLESQALLKDVFIKTKFEQGPFLITCEMNQLKQVFVNIIKNAIESMPHGGGLSIYMYRKDQFICLDFCDEGTGISPETLAKLGNPFFTTKQGGTGLGLMVSQKIILAHQGTFTISSIVNQGTNVHICLPAADK